MHKDRKNRRAFDRSFCLGVLCSSSVLMAACSRLSSSESERRVEQDSQSLYVKTDKIWNDATIPVCWERPDSDAGSGSGSGSGSDLEKGWVRDAVARTWETQAAISFGGWATCDDSSRGIRIAVGDAEWPRTVNPGLGSELDGVHKGMFLTFSPINVLDPKTGKKAFPNCGGDRREFCIRAQAVHEFGHALGFSHEQNRPDEPSFCVCCDQNNVCRTCGPSGENGDQTFGGFDLSSVMSYCFPNWNNDGNLTPTDIAGAVNYYGGPRSFSSVSWSNRVAVFYKNAQRNLFVEIFNGANWSYRGLGDDIASDPVAVGWGTDRLDVFVRKGDGFLWHRASGDGGGSWSPWERLGDRPIVGDPAVAFQTTRIHVVARGADDSLLHWWAEKGQGWTLEVLQGKVASALSVVSWAVGRLDMFFLNSSGGLEHRWYQSGVFYVESLGGTFYGAPSAVSWGQGRIDIFLRGVDNTLWHKWYDQGSWNGNLESLGGSFAGNPAVVSRGPNRLDVFARGVHDDMLYHRSYSDGSWSPPFYWESLGGPMGGSPACSSAGPNLLDVFVRNANSQLVRRRWDGNWHDYEFLAPRVR